jgi:hypothetical protein
MSEQKKRRRLGMVERPESGYVRMRLTVYLSPELGKRFRVWCATEGVEMSAAIEDVLAAHLAGGEP